MQNTTKQAKAQFKDVHSYLYSSRIDESILDNFDELDTPTAVSRISKDVTGSFTCSVMVVLNIKSGLTASYTNIRQVCERLFEVCNHSRLFKDCLISSVILETDDTETGEVMNEELDPNNIPDGYSVLADFLEKYDHKKFGTIMPHGQIVYEISFNPTPELSFEKYAQHMRQFIDKASSVVTRNDKDTGHISICSYDVPNTAIILYFFQPMKTDSLVESYNLLYHKDLKPDDNTENEIYDKARQQFTRSIPSLLQRSIVANVNMTGTHGVWIEYKSFEWIAEHSLLIEAHVRQRFDDEPLSVSNILFTLVRTLFIYIPDSITTTNAICVSVTADDIIIDVNNKVPTIGRPDQTKFDEKVLINTSARPWAMDLTDGDKVFRTNRFIRVMLGKGDDKTGGIPVGVIFPLKNGHVGKNWFNYKIKYSGSLKHNEWFQPFLEVNLSD